MMKFEYRDSRMLRLREHFANSSAVILVSGVIVAALWLMVAPSIIGSSSDGGSGTAVLADAGLVSEGAVELLPGMRLIDDFQISQPRDPFRPLITEEVDGTGDGGARAVAGTARDPSPHPGPFRV